MNNLLQDVRYALRMLAKAPGFTLVAVVTLALGIGANSVTFTMLKGVLLRPLPGVPAGEEIHAVISIGNAGQQWPMSYPDYRDLRDRNTVFQTLAASAQMPMNVRIGNGAAKRVWGEAVSGNWFQMLGTGTVLGRPLNVEDERTTATNPAVVIGYGFWQREFGGRLDVIGRSLTIGSRTFTIAGVTGKPFRGSVSGLALDLFVPLEMYKSDSDYRELLENRGDHWLIVQGRLRRGAKFAAASAAVGVLGEQVRKENKKDGVRTLAVLIPLWKSPFGAQKMLLPVYSILTIVAMFVLLISCANVANLLLARATNRQREIAVRRALGASRWRLIRQLLTESVLLSLAGGVAGMLAGLWYGDSFSKIPIPTPFPAVLDIRFDWLVFGFAFAISLVSGIIFGLAPAVQTSAANMITALRAGSTTGGSARSHLRSALVLAQIAAACLLLIGAGLAGRSFENANTLDPGFETEHIALSSIDIKAGGYDRATGPAFFRRLLERTAAQPGVEAAGIATSLPLLVFGGSQQSVEVDGYVPRPDENTSLYYNVVSPGYFSSMKIGVSRGRDFEWRDDAAVPDVAIVSEAFARQFFPGGETLGRRIRTGGKWREIVGVARDIRYLTLTEAPRSMIYLPLLQNFDDDVVLHVRTAQNPAGAFTMVQSVVKELDATVPVYKSRTMREHLRFSKGGYYIASNLMGAAGIISLFLATLGIYGVISYAVGQRTREIGIRMALGANRRDILRLVVGQGLFLAVTGVLLGGAAALGLARLLGSILLGVSAHDPAIFSVRALLLAVVALLACYVPARRAARIDPMVALRYE